MTQYYSWEELVELEAAHKEAIKQLGLCVARNKIKRAAIYPEEMVDEALHKLHLFAFKGKLRKDEIDSEGNTLFIGTEETRVFFPTLFFILTLINVIHDERRRLKRKRRWQNKTFDSTFLNDVSVEEQSLLSVLITKESATAAVMAIRECKTCYRLVQLRFWHGMTFAEIAAEIGDAFHPLKTTADSVRTRLNKCLVSMRASLE